MVAQLSQGSLKYNLPSNNFSINPTGTADGWVPLPLSPDVEQVTKKDLEVWADKLGGQNQSRIYVDKGAPLASDSRNNRGNSKLRPFKTIERALIEAARISFKKGENNDAFERVSISIAPGEYEVQNGPRSLVDVFNYYTEYLNASSLVADNRDSIVNIAKEAATNVTFKNPEYIADLEYFINSIAEDLNSAGNYYTIQVSKSLVSTDFNIVKGDSNFYVDRYDVTIGGTTSRASMIACLEAVKTEIIDIITAGTDTISITGAALTEISTAVTNLVDIIIDTLDVASTFDPRNQSAVKYGKYTQTSFPVDEPSRADLQRFNSASKAGIILPRGVSIIGEDLRKVVIRPTFVPDPTDPLVGRGAIFRMTGGNFFSGFTIKDKLPKGGTNTSHHKLTAFEFCTKDELDSYYTSVNTAFSDKSIYNRAIDSANLIEKNEEWIEERCVPKQASNDEEKRFARIYESEIQNIISAIQKDLKGLTSENSISLGRRFYSDHIIPLSTDAPVAPETETERQRGINYYKELLRGPNNIASLYEALIDAITNTGGVIDLEVIDSNIETFVLGVNTFIGRCADIQAALYTFIDILITLIEDGDTDIQTLPDFANDFSVNDIEVVNQETSIVLGLTEAEESSSSINEDKLNTVFGASPYIFSASIRSEYGLCGIDGDGSSVTGLRSYLAAQFTIISLQRDSVAFETDPIEVGGKRYKGNKLSDPQDYSHFGYRVSNGAYSQLVSCFCIGPAKHYIADSGGEFSITNSTSNFGDISLYSKGFNTTRLDGTIDGVGAYTQDRGHELVGIIKPKTFYINDENYQYFLVGSINDYRYSTDNDPPEDITDDSNWTSEPTTWKGWTEDYGTIIQENEPNAEDVYALDRPLFSEFTAIKYIRLVFRGSLADLEDVIEKDENGKPILHYIYCNSPLSVSPPAPPNPILPPGHSQTVINFNPYYNVSLNKERRGKVLDVVDNEQGFTYILLDVRDWNISNNTSSGARGEWFERDTFYQYEGSERVSVRTTLRGLNVYAKRFADDRDPEDRRYRFIFKREDNLKRIPPSNFIVRKQTGILTENDQPFKFISPTQLNTLYHSKNVNILKNSDLSELTNNNTIISILETKNQESGTGPLLFTCELLSSNADIQGKPNTEDDIAENAKFLWTEDAEEILDSSETYIQNLLATPTSENYLSKISLENFINLAGISNQYDSTIFQSENRIDLGDTNNPTQFAFCKPSTIRASGQTWEYMGYYNYSTSLPILQTENLGDRLEGNQKKIFRLDKIQRNVLGGRVYASGMDELGNIIQGSTIIDLKTGVSETVIEGVTPEINTAGDISVSNEISPIDVAANTLARHKSVTAIDTVDIDFRVSSDQQISATIKPGSITLNKLSYDIVQKFETLEAFSTFDLALLAGQVPQNVEDLYNGGQELEAYAEWIKSLPLDESLIIYLTPLDIDVSPVTKAAIIPYFPFSMRVEKLILNVDEAPVGNSIVVDIIIDDVPFFATQSGVYKQISIDDGELSSETSSSPYVIDENLFDQSRIPIGSKVEINIDQSGLTSPGRNLTLVFEGERA